MDRRRERYMRCSCVLRVDPDLCDRGCVGERWGDGAGGGGGGAGIAVATGREERVA